MYAPIPSRVSVMASRQKRASALQRAFLVEGTQPTSLFQALYRMCNRSNYVGSDDFVNSVSIWQAAHEHNEATRGAYWHTIANLEVLVARLSARSHAPRCSRASALPIVASSSRRSPRRCPGSSSAFRSRPSIPAAGDVCCGLGGMCRSVGLVGGALALRCYEWTWTSYFRQATSRVD